MTVTFSSASLLLLLVPVLFFWQISYGQNSNKQFGEFPEEHNGLIYGEMAMSKLKYIVDSLNLKFKVCELQKTYLSVQQARAHYLSLEQRRLKEAMADLERHMPPDEFIRKYPGAKLDKDLLVVKSRYSNDYTGEETVEFRSIPFQNKGDHLISISDYPVAYTQSVKGRWIISQHANQLEAFYFPEDFRQQPLPLPYARMVQYTDCLVDTSTQIFLKKPVPFGTIVPERAIEIDRFLQYVHQETSMPKPDKDYSETYSKKLRRWYETRLSVIDRQLAHREEFKALLEDAVTAALAHGGSEEELEEYVERYYAKATALELKRNRRVFGRCSMDDSPRVHALNIARLSAETVHWQTFLRAHLDIMNDRFERMSDGSYAWGARKTYIRELEVLDINVADLLLGISLRIANPDKNHYFGNIGRLGRAFSESEQAAELEQNMLHMITDQQLDDFNRVLIYYLFLNYNNHLEDVARQVENTQKLNEAVKTLPAYLAATAPKKE